LGLRMVSAATSVREAGVGALAQVSATLADAFATEPILRWLIPRQQRRDSRLRRYFAMELAHSVFPAGRVLTTDDFRGANLELPPSAWKMTMPLSAAIGWVPILGLRLPRAIRLQVFMSQHHLPEPHSPICRTRRSARSCGACARRTTSCAGPTRSLSRPRCFSPRSSTRTERGERVHRRAAR
jgi:hypothetical protein